LLSLRVFVVCLLLVAGTVIAPSASARPLGHGPLKGKVLPRTAALRSPGRYSGPTGGVTYHGGPVAHRSTSYAIFWAGSSQSFPPAFERGITRFLEAVAAESGSHGNVYATTAEYADTSGVAAYDSKFGGAYQDTAPLPNAGCSSPFGDPCVSGGQIQEQLDSFIAASGLPRGLHSVYLVFLPPGHSTCSGSSCAYTNFCGYHSWIGFGPSATPYAVLPWSSYAPAGSPLCSGPLAPNGDPALDTTLSTVSHEQIEILTDPVGGGWFDSAGQEVADKCAWNLGPALGSSAFGDYNQRIGSGDYALQLEWSNAASGCVSHSDFAPPPPPSNDLFSSAQALPRKRSAVASGTTFEATKEAGEPSHAGNEGGASIWFKWTPRKLGLASLDTSGSSFDTVLAVYTGTSVTNLTEVASDDDSPFVDQSAVRFVAHPGATYRIAVDGFNVFGEPPGGEVRLNLAEKPPPQTRIRGRHRIVTSRHFARVAFRLQARPAATRFECALDGRGYRRCGRRPRFAVAPGAHRLVARAVGAEGLRDPSPARFSFDVSRR